MQTSAITLLIWNLGISEHGLTVLYFKAFNLRGNHYTYLQKHRYKKNHILKWAQALSCTDNQHKRIEWEKSHGLGHDRSVTVAKWPILAVWDRQASVLFVSASAVSCAHFIVLFGFNLFLWLDIWIATKFSTFKSNKLRCYL